MPQRRRISTTKLTKKKERKKKHDGHGVCVIFFFSPLRLDRALCNIRRRIALDSLMISSHEECRPLAANDITPSQSDNGGDALHNILFRDGSARLSQCRILLSRKITFDRAAPPPLSARWTVICHLFHLFPFSEGN